MKVVFVVLALLAGGLAQAQKQQAQLLVPVLPGWAPRPGMVHAVFPSRRGQAPVVRSFLDFMGEHMQGDQLVNSRP